MAGLSIKSCVVHPLGISVVLLLIFLQTIVLHISPAFSSQNSHHEELPSRCWELLKMDILNIVAALCFNLPVLLVAFAMLSMLLATYAKDRTTLWFSLVCQAASCLVTLGAIIMLLVSFRSSLRLYLSLGVEVQLTITTFLTRLLGKKLPSDWE